VSQHTPILARLGSCLRRASYGPDALATRLGIRVPDDVGPLNHAAAIERLHGDDSPAAMLTRLFFLETSEPAARIARAVGKDLVSALAAARLLAHRNGRLLTRLRLDPVGEHWLLADLRFRSPDQGALALPAGDPVYPPGSDSLLLRDATVPIEGGTTLDLCTGSGIQALAASAHAARVVAVDISRRAAGVTEMNLALNHVTNVETRVGNLYRPVAGERFDTVIANPPFVASPYRTGPAYHSGGPTGARVLSRIATGLSAALAPGGRFFAVSHLALRGREQVADVARPWLEQFPGRALILVLESGSAIDLAAAQALFALGDGLAAYAAEVRRWVGYLRKHHVREVVVVLLVAERRGRKRLDVVEAFQRTLPLPLSHPPLHHVQGWLAAS